MSAVPAGHSGATSGSMIKLSKISKSYQMGLQPVHALQDVSLHIRKGSYVSIMGPSGSGKSTLMNIIGCLDLPDSGQYLLDGEDVSELGDDDLAQVRSTSIGFVFQVFNLLPRTSADKQVMLPLIYAGIPRSERRRRANKLLTMVGLGDRLDHRPDELSGGEQQRVAIARSMASEPLLILADEPTGNLDSVSGEEILGIFEELHDQGITVVMVTHDRHLAARTERIIRLRDGRIESDTVNSAATAAVPTVLEEPNGSI